ncbi:Uncharacterised protein [uncultured archaeon]|nr:Uncharacterised protein [uncultured archaeon]
MEIGCDRDLSGTVKDFSGHKLAMRASPENETLSDALTTESTLNNLTLLSIRF